MNAGKYRHRITIERKAVPIRDPETGMEVPPENDWEVVTLPNGLRLNGVPASVLTGPGKEPRASQADWGQIDARINFRWLPIQETDLYKWRVKWLSPSGEARYFNIKAVELDITGMREIRLKCESGVNEG